MMMLMDIPVRHEPVMLREVLAALDVRPGGEGVFRWENGESRRAVVDEVDEGERLVLRWDDDGRVELELDDAPAGTRVLVRETSPEWGVALELEACAAWAIA